MERERETSVRVGELIEGLRKETSGVDSGGVSHPWTADVAGAVKEGERGIRGRRWKKGLTGGTGRSVGEGARPT